VSLITAHTIGTLSDLQRAVILRASDQDARRISQPPRLEWLTIRRIRHLT